jgi:hypothetical protein
MWRRAMLHCRGVGKVLLAQLDNQAVLRIVRRTGLPARTAHTLTTENSLLADLERIRERGYAFDDGEQEIGVRCAAVPVASAPGTVALSVSGPSARISDDHIKTASFQPWCARPRTFRPSCAEIPAGTDRPAGPLLRSCHACRSAGAGLGVGGVVEQDASARGKQADLDAPDKSGE